jgi:hypothetical protein
MDQILYWIQTNLEVMVLWRGGSKVMGHVCAEKKQGTIVNRIEEEKGVGEEAVGAVKNTVMLGNNPIQIFIRRRLEKCQTIITIDQTTILKHHHLESTDRNSKNAPRDHLHHKILIFHRIQMRVMVMVIKKNAVK